MFEFYRRDGRKKIGTAANSAPLGSIIMTISTMSGSAGSLAEATSAPLGFLFCNGASIPTASFPELSAALLPVFGGGGGNFNLPDYRNFFPVGVGPGYTLGVAGGAATHTHTVTPGHTHALAGHLHYMGATWGSHTHTFDHTHLIEEHVHGDGASATNGSLSAVASSGAADEMVITGPNNAAKGLHTHALRGFTGPSSADQTLGASPSTSGGPGAGPSATDWNYSASVGGPNTAPTVDSRSNIPPSLSINFMVKF